MKYLIILTAFAMLAGCRFEGPLTERPTREVDSVLLGSWFSLADGSALDIYRLSRQEYLVSDAGTPYVCTHSDLSKTNFISCKQLKNDKEYYGKYVYLAYKLGNGILTVLTLNDALKIKETLAPAQIRTLLEEAVKNGNALDTDAKHQRHFKKKA